MPRTKYAESVKAARNPYAALLATIHCAFTKLDIRSNTKEAEFLGVGQTTWCSKMRYPNRIDVDDVILLVKKLNLTSDQLGKMFGTRDAK